MICLHLIFNYVKLVYSENLCRQKKHSEKSVSLKGNLPFSKYESPAETFRDLACLL